MYDAERDDVCGHYIIRLAAHPSSVDATCYLLRSNHCRSVFIYFDEWRGGGSGGVVKHASLSSNGEGLDWKILLGMIVVS